MLGGPGNWSSMMERLGADPAIRAQCQFLTFGYDCFQSIPESARQLREMLAEARLRLDPAGQDPALERVVLIGHSMGGLVAKAMAAGTLEREAQSLAAVVGPSGGMSRPAPPRVSRVVCIATPHHGTRVDQGAVRSVGRWVARTLSPSCANRRPSDVNPGMGMTERPRSSVDELTWDHPLLRDLDQAGAASSVPFHSIVAVLGQASDAAATDGVVPVASARLAGARSELLVRTHHLCLQHPEVIGEVGRVLNEAGSGRLKPTLPEATALSGEDTMR
jgi:pimeloyl-ACP methyl ester carboxylesterase